MFCAVVAEVILLDMMVRKVSTRWLLHYSCRSPNAMIAKGAMNARIAGCAGGGLGMVTMQLFKQISCTIIS